MAILQYTSTSRSPQEHRFFKHELANDLSLLTKELQDRYTQISEATVTGVTPVGADDQAWKDSNSISTMKWSQYNVFQFHIPGIRELYNAVSKMTHEACDYYEIDFDSQQFMLQGWFNINHSKSGKLDWHEHSPNGAPFFHGYYSVSAEPSSTHYRTSSGNKINENKNNEAILSEMGHPHAQGDWSWDGPRITVAYDVLPLSVLLDHPEEEQHWVPLG
jgi:hypothetical protein